MKINWLKELMKQDIKPGVQLPKPDYLEKFFDKKGKSAQLKPNNKRPDLGKFDIAVEEAHRAYNEIYFNPYNTFSVLEDGGYKFCPVRVIVDNDFIVKGVSYPEPVTNLSRLNNQRIDGPTGWNVEGKPYYKFNRIYFSDPNAPEGSSKAPMDWLMKLWTHSWFASYNEEIMRTYLRHLKNNGYLDTSAEAEFERRYKEFSW